MNLSLSEISSAVDGVLAADGSLVVENVQTDSRNVTAGSLFVAIQGENVDGLDFAETAIEKGAVAVLCTQAISVPHILVDDPVVALGQIAALQRKQLNATTIAITGSSGKTSTKDMLAQVLATRGEVVSPVGNFNNEIGMPLTLLKANSQTDFLVLEMGMRGLGQIRYLCEIAKPEIAIVLNVGTAHMELLGSIASVAEAKGEIVESLPASGLAVLLADDPLVAQIASRTSANITTFGESQSADVCISDLRLDERARAEFVLTYKGESAEVRLQVSGEHQALNAAAVAAVGLHIGMSLSEIAIALGKCQSASKWRMQITEMPNGITVINDAYNANPESMRAGLKALKAMSQGRTTWAVLGEMRELGNDSVLIHDEIGRLCVRLDISRLIAIGAAGKIMQIGAAQEGSWGNEAQWVADLDEATYKLLNEVRPGDIVFFKASRSIGLERVAESVISAWSGENSAS